MASVMNGAVGKSPLIDRLNQIPDGKIGEMVAGQMEQLVCAGTGLGGQAIPASFDECRKEMGRQLCRLRQEGERRDGGHGLPESV